MKNRRNYYRILQVQPDAPVEVIRSTYYTIMRKLKQHPDLGGDHWNATIINEAYQVLSDEKRRAEYDKQLLKSYTHKPVSDSSKKPLQTLFCPFCKYPLSREPAAIESCPQCNSPLKLSDSEVVGQCRRSIERLKKSGKIKYYYDWPQQGHEAEIIDISPKGMRFSAQERIKKNVVLKITSPDMIAIAQVVNAYKLHKLSFRYKVGVKFLAVKFAKQAGTFYSSSC